MCKETLKLGVLFQFLPLLIITLAYSKFLNMLLNWRANSRSTLG